jgi:hypothetical protein
VVVRAGRKASRHKATTEANAAADAMVDDPVYRAKLALDLQVRRVAPPIEQMLW